MNEERDSFITNARLRRQINANHVQTNSLFSQYNHDIHLDYVQIAHENLRDGLKYFSFVGLYLI